MTLIGPPPTLLSWQRLQHIVTLNDTFCDFFLKKLKDQYQATLVFWFGRELVPELGLLQILAAQLTPELRQHGAEAFSNFMRAEILPTFGRSTCQLEDFEVKILPKNNAS